MIRPPTGEAFKLMIKKRNVSCKKKKNPQDLFKDFFTKGLIPCCYQTRLRDSFVHITLTAH